MQEIVRAGQAETVILIILSILWIILLAFHPYLDAHPCFGTSIHAFAETLDGVWMEQSKTYISSDRASMLHPGFGGWSSRCPNRIRLVVLIILHLTTAL